MGWKTIGGEGDGDRERDLDGELIGERVAGAGASASAGTVELVSKKVETAESRSKLCDSKKKRASSLEDEVISENVLIRSV